MSDELRLPDELAACEALLAAKPLAATGIDRDQLLYRAGWAACEASLAGVVPPRVNGGLRGGTLAAWSLTSAAIAASLAVIVTLQWRPVDMGELASDPAGLRPPLAVKVAPSRTTELPRVEFTWALATSEKLGRLDDGLIAMRQQVMTNAWSEPTNVASINGDAAAPAKTARELMQELMPAESARPTSVWPWKHASQGESI